MNLVAAGTNAFAASSACRETTGGYDASSIAGLTHTDWMGAVSPAFTCQYAANSNRLGRMPG